MASVSQPVGLLTLVSVILVGIILPIFAELPDYNEIKEVLDKNENITIELLQTFFEKSTGIQYDKVPKTRLFPLCIHLTTLAGFSSLKNFVPIWKKMEMQVKLAECKSRPLRFYEYNASVHSMRHNRNWIESIVLSRINTPEVDVRNLRQWMHIKVKAKTPLQALYMQPVVGSIGLSSGEFSLEFQCSDLPEGDTSAKDSMLFHCDYRSRAELNHPVAFFGGYEGTKQIPEFHVHYKWTDISCLETPFLQFILIAIKDFKAESNDGPELGVDFQPLLSPVYTNIDFDSKDGVITPYYIDWKDSMTCFKASHDSSWKRSGKLYHDTNFAAVSWKESQLDRLIANEDYDKCISDRDIAEQDKDHKECGPGPFQCPQELSHKFINDQTDFKKIVERRQTEFDEAMSTGDCVPCVFPQKEQLYSSCQSSLRELEPRQTQDNITPAVTRVLDPYLYLDYSEYLNTPVETRYHGAIAIFCYFVVAPFSSFLARFFRGTPIRYSGKEDFWIFIHGGLHFVSLFLLWISIGFVSTLDENISRTAEHCFKKAEQIKRNSTNDDSEWTQESFMTWLDKCTYESRKRTHSALGILSFIIHNVTVLMSFFRSRTDYIRNIQVILHSHLGYIDMLLSVVTIFYALNEQRCSEISGYIITSIVASTIMFLIMNCITSCEDEELKIDPPRYKWPILEPIKITFASSFYDRKIAVLGVYGAILAFLLIFTLVSLNREHSSETSTLSLGNSYHTVTGIFGPCLEEEIFIPDLNNKNT